MKAILKVLAMLLVLALGAGLPGCQKEDENSEPDETTEQVEREDTTEDDSQEQPETPEE